MPSDQEPARNGATAQSIEMLKAVIDGDTYEMAGARFGVTRTAIERRIKAIAVRLSKVVSVKGRVLRMDDPQVQDSLAQVHGTPERPRCQCVPGGVEMYVARHRQFVVKRMPDTGSRHHPGCPSYEPEPRQSGLGELVGEAVQETESGSVELRVDFPWTRTIGGGMPRGEPKAPAEVGVPRRRMSLRALMHFLFERAGFNRWSPAMEGKRNQGVLHKYLLEAAEDVSVKGVVLADRLYVPEPFSEATKVDSARRRREKLAVLQPRDGRSPLAVVLGEFKTSEATALGRRIWIRHMPDAPLLVANQTWERIERLFAPLFEARDADTGYKVRLMIAALIRGRREHTYEIDAASLMLTSEHWIPVEGIHELPLVHALVEQRRRFAKPLRYDAKSAAGFPNALLLDAGATPNRLLKYLTRKSAVSEPGTLSLQTHETPLMRGPDTFTEGLFTMRRLDDFVPADHPLRRIRVMVNEALAKMDGLFSRMYEADIKGGRPSIAPEKLLRAMLLQILFSIRSERQLMEQTQYNMLFRWFIGLAMDDAVWVPTVFSKNRQRLIEHDAVVAFFNEVLETAENKDWLSGEHFSVDGTLIQAWAGHKSFVRKDGDDDADSGGDFKGQRRSNDTHESKTDPDSKLYRRGKTGSELRYMGHTLTDNRHGLVVNAMVTQADGFAEREAAKAMIWDARQATASADAEVTLGADKGYDAAEFIEELHRMKVTPHVAQNKSGRRSAVADEIARSEGYAISQRKRKLIEQGFGWAKFVGPIRQVMVRGIKKVDQLFVLTMAAYNLVRMRTLAQVRPLAP